MHYFFLFIYIIHYSILAKSILACVHLNHKVYDQQKKDIYINSKIVLFSIHHLFNHNH